MINHMIADPDLRGWADQVYNDWVADFAKTGGSETGLPARHRPEPRSQGCGRRGSPLREAGNARRRSGFQAHGCYRLWHHDWYALWEAAAECWFPISFHSTGFQATRAPNTPEMEKQYFTQYRLVRSALFQTDTMEVLVSMLASGACDKYPEFNFVLGESG